jgi:hypothetical protein
MSNEQMQVKEFSKQVSRALGQEKLGTLSARQKVHLNKALGRLVDSKPLDKITDKEIEGQYNLVVDHLSPAAYEVR